MAIERVKVLMDEESGLIDAEFMRNPELRRNLQAVFDSARKSVCKVKPVHNDQVTGAVYEVVDRNDVDCFLFMTCNHVLPTNSLNEISQAILEFEDILQSLNIFSLIKKDVKYIWTSKLYDVTIVEISSEVTRLFKSAGVIFLKVGRITSNAEVATGP